MQDPYFAVKEEVEATLSVVVDLHTKWLRLERKSDEFEWTSSELLSGLRSIEWDLQDLEDTVSIVEGNTAKFQLDASDIEGRKQFIEATRKRIVMMRDEVQGTVQGGSDGFSTSKASAALPGTKKSKGYGKIGVQDDSPLPMHVAREDMESVTPAACSSAPDVADEILGAELEPLDTRPSPGRHRKKKACLFAVVLLLAVGAWAASMLSGGSVGGSVVASAASEGSASTAAGAAPPSPPLAVALDMPSASELGAAAATASSPPPAPRVGSERRLTDIKVGRRDILSNLATHHVPQGTLRQQRVVDRR